MIEPGQRPRGGADRAMARTSGTVLVAEDDGGLLRLIRRCLEVSGYRVLVADDGPTALDLAVMERPSLVLLDIGLPGLDGLTICQRLREVSDVPIIMITARTDEEDVVCGLQTGADEYLPKPFGMKELVARVAALLRRARPAEAVPRGVYAYGDLQVDFLGQRVTRADQDIALTPTEYRLLVALASHPGLVLTQQQLLERVWGPEYPLGRNLLHVNVRRLRRKIEADPDTPRYLLTKHGVGYYMPKPA
jgi:two-component system, OmpR family, response regulator MtrA